MATRPPRPRKVTPPPPPLQRPYTTGSPASDFDIPHDLQSALGLVLWKSLRDVHVCFEVEADVRRRLLRPPNHVVRERFAAARLEAPDLGNALSTFLLLLRSPHLVPESALAAACHEVYEWADERGHKLIAYHFSEAAAYAAPDDPARANFAARMARRSLMKERAALWYLRAHRVAIVVGRKREAIYALLGYGTMMKDLGNFKEARRAFERAARRASAAGKDREAAEAYHDLFAIALEVGRFRLAERHLRKALSFYPVRHLRIPALAYDIAFFLIRQAQFSAALMVLERTVLLTRRPEEQPLVWSAVAWAAGAAGLGGRFDEAERTTLEQVELFDDFAPAIFIHLAEGCRALRRWERAAVHAEAAREAAVARNEPPLASEAAELRAAIARREDGPPQAPEAVGPSSLARTATVRLQRWATPGRGRPGAGSA